MNIKKSFTLIAFLFAAIFSGMAVEATTGLKPKIMVIPGDRWCESRGYMLGPNSPDYERALIDRDMEAAIILVGQEMADRGCEIYSFKQYFKNKHTSDAYTMVVPAKDGTMPIVSERDEALNNAGIDFIVELDIAVKNIGLRQQVEFLAEMRDAASEAILFGDMGTSKDSNCSVADHMKEAVGCFIHNFVDMTALAFDRLQERGREGRVEFHISEDCPINLEDEITVKGETGELAEYIEYWISQHTTDGKVSLRNKSAESAYFEQVRFPLTAKATKGGFGGKKMRAMSMHSFISDMAQDLAPLGIAMTVMPIGQGRAYVVLGAKR